MTTNETAIRTQPRPRCCLCGAQGRTLYFGLRDRLFSAPGVWSFNRCANERCGLVWLDPAPVEDDLLKTYAAYYHNLNKGAPADQPGVAVRGLQFLWRGWAWLTTADRFQRNLERIRPAGAMLDVGCGTGDRLARMRGLGWTVEGLETNPDAATIAREKHRLIVHDGALEKARLPSEGYDLITLAHVIEHVNDPAAMLKECRRLLRPAGALFLNTPNGEGYGARTFGQDWISLEPPRHLYLFCKAALDQLARLAGFDRARVTALPGPNTLFSPLASLNVRRRGRHTPGRLPSPAIALRVPYHQLRQALLCRISSQYGDELQLQAKKC